MKLSSNNEYGGVSRGHSSESEGSNNDEVPFHESDGGTAETYLWLGPHKLKVFERKRNRVTLIGRYTFNHKYEKPPSRKSKQTKASLGVDGVTVEEIDEYMSQRKKESKKRIMARQYRPQPVLRVEIPKENGGVRKLGIPTVLDRIILQAVAEKLTPIFDPLFSSHSYGFSPGKSTHQAIIEFTRYLNEGYTWIVDLDLEKFFDNIPQDRLMSLVGRVINDGDTESLIRKYLKAGVINEGVFEDTTLGVSQGGGLSPLLADVMLNEKTRNWRKEDCISSATPMTA